MKLNSLLSAALLPLLAACASLAYGDWLTVRGLAAGEDSVVALNAKTPSGAGCLRGQDGDEWSTRPIGSDGSVKLGNLRKGCVLRVVVFSRDHAMLAASLRGWTNGDGDVRAVTVRPAIRVPIAVWITHKDLDKAARAHMARASELYKQNLVGIVFEPAYPPEAADADKVKLITAGFDLDGNDSVCGRIEGLRGRAYTPRTLNVYYIDRDFVSRNCATKRTPTCDDYRPFPKADGNIIYISKSDLKNPATLSHELGHAFGLRPGPCGGHVPSDGFDFGPDNIMVGGGFPTRNHFTLGQVFRMNTQQDRWGGTMLITNGLRPGPARHCELIPWEVTNSKCPPHCLDRTPGACGGP